MDKKVLDESNASDGREDLTGAVPADILTGELVDLVVRYFCMGHSGSLKSLLEQFERNILEHVLAQTHWNQRKTADILGVKYTTLNHKVIKMGLQISEEELRQLRLKDIVAEASRRRPKDRLLRPWP